MNFTLHPAQLWPAKPTLFRRACASMRARLYGLLIWLVLLAGFRVLVFGRIRAGKSYLLERTFPASHRIDGAKATRVALAQATPFDCRQLPTGVFAIDDACCLDASDLQASFDALKNRRFVLATPSPSDIDLLGLRALFADRWVLELHLGHKPCDACDQDSGRQHAPRGG